MLFTPIEKIAGIGPVYQKRLKKMGVKTIRDILYLFPHRYEDFSNIKPISKIKINETACIAGKILEIEETRTWKKKMLLTEAIIQDKTGAIRAVWFYQPYLTRYLKIGDNVCMAGKASLSNGKLSLNNPSYEKISTINDLTHTGRIVPIYPETQGLSSRWLRYIIKGLLINFKEIPEILPQKIINDNNFLPIDKALWQIHFPDKIELSEKAKKRFSFEQLFLIQLTVLKERMFLNTQTAVSMPMNVALIKKFVETFSFKLTDAQKKCSWQILKDLEKSRPMNRLLQGDVGSGKTLVALIAALQTIKSKHQVAFMAPTEILSKQHFQEVSKRFQNFNINVGLLTGKEDKFISKKLKNQTIEISRKKLLEKTKEKEMDILIGTHALIQDKVKFGDLGLVILDEQHRFGVEQRAKLGAKQNEKSAIPHLLSMTATPIPRTLALTIYGDLDLSLIDELPKGRKKIITKLTPPLERKKTYTFIKQQVKKGRQVFVICPRIEKTPSPEDKTTGKEKTKLNNWDDVKTVKEEYEKLSKKIFPDLKIKMLHGKMTPKEKEKIMYEFSGGKPASAKATAWRRKKRPDILVSTSVIEVGIDIPNATVMVIEGAERFGLSQLHQFRGRVGRSKYQSYCFLFTDSHSVKTRQRLKALISSENGFDLAEKDLKIRGPGDFTGTRQWGIPDIAMDSLKDIPLVEKTRESAKEILEQDPELKNLPALCERLQKFQQKIHLE